MYFCDQFCTNAYNNVQQVFFHLQFHNCNFVFLLIVRRQTIGAGQTYTPGDGPGRKETGQYWFLCKWLLNKFGKNCWKILGHRCRWCLDIDASFESGTVSLFSGHMCLGGQINIWGALWQIFGKPPDKYLGNPLINFWEAPWQIFWKPPSKYLRSP